MQKQLSLLLVSLIFIFPSFVRSAEPLVFGVVPQQSAAKLALQWVPFIEEWGREANVEIQFATAPDIPTFEKRLEQGEYDIAYMNPYHFTLVNQAPGYTAIAKAKNKRIRGIIVTRKDWKGDLTHFDQQTIAFPAPRAFAATIINQSELRAKGAEFEPKYVGSHDSVYLSVARGLYVAGGGVMRTFNSLPKETADKLQVIHTSAGYTPHAFAVSKQLDPNITKRMIDALSRFDDNKVIQASLKSLRIGKLETAQDTDWNDVIDLKIKIDGAL